MTENERRELAGELVRLRQDFERQVGLLEREHTRYLAVVEEAKHAAARVGIEREELQQGFRAASEDIRRRLVEARDSSISVFLADMRHELGFGLHELRQAPRVVSTAEFDARRAAIERVILEAEQLTYQALDAQSIAIRVSELRSSVPHI